MPYGMYLLNPNGRRAKKRKAKRSFSTRNPMKKTRRKSRRHSLALRNPPKRRKARRSFSRRNPARRRRRAGLKHVLFLNPMKHRRRKSRRRSFAARNPAGRSRRRRSMFSFRNPSGVVSSVFSRENLTMAGGIVTGNVASALVLNKLLLPDASGKIPLRLPGVDTTKQGYMQSMPVSLYKVIIGGGIGLLVMKKYPRFGQGMILGAVAGLVSDAVRQSNVLASLPGGNQALGVGRYFPPANRNGTSSYVPGVSPVFTGPGSAFLGGGSPRARINGNPGRGGMGAALTRSTASSLAGGVADPFRS